MEPDKRKSSLQHNEISNIISDIFRLTGSFPLKPDTPLAVDEIRQRLKLIEDHVSSLADAIHDVQELFSTSESRTRIGSCFIDLDKRTWLCTGEADKILGITDSFPKIPEAWRILIHPDDLPLVAAHISQIIIDKMNFDFDFRVIRYNDKAERWIMGLGEIVYDASGKPLSVMGTLQDITEKKILELDLIESEEQYRNLFENSVVGMYQTSPDGTILRVNRALCDMLGYSSVAELKLRNLEKDGFLSGYAREEFKQEILSTGVISGRESVWLKKNGQRVYIREHARTVKNQNGEILYYEGTVENITEKKMAERALQENMDLLNLQSSRMPIALMYWNAKGLLIDCNPAALKLFGYKIDEVLGKHAGDFFTSPAIRENLQIFSERLLSGDIQPRCSNENITKNGDVILCEWTNIPYNDFDGKFAGFISVVQDVTLRHNVQRALWESERRYKTLAHHAPFPVILLHQVENTILYANTAALKKFDLSKDEAFGRHIREFCTAPDFWKQAGTPPESGSPNQLQEVEMHSFYGQKFWTLVDISHAQYANQPAIFISFYDITERKKIEEALISARQRADELSKLKSAFLANISHELRTPLIGILGYAEMLEDNVHDDVNKQYIGVIRENGGRLLDTFNQVLELTRLHSESIKLQKSEFDILGLVKEILKNFKSSVEKKNLLLQLKAVRPEIQVTLDKTIVGNIINNLVHNAIKFTPSGNVMVRVSEVTTADGECISISVQDTGIGIPVEKQSAIWNEFRQGSEGYSRAFEGVGLGLALVRKYIELMNGEVIMESEPGIGSTFTVLIPVAEALASDTVNEADQQEYSAIPDSSSLRKPDVLYIENDSYAVSVAKHFLNDYCIIQPVKSIEEIAGIIRGKKFQAIFVDINLGEGPDGLSIAQYIRAFPEYENIPIIGITAFTAAGSQKEFLLKGCTHHISKPFKKNDLRKLISGILPE
jgi:PAS domain S-box-containing protein